MITEFGGEAIGSTEDLVAAIAAHEPGEAVTVKVDSGSGKTEEVKVTLGTQPAESGAG